MILVIVMSIRWLTLVGLLALPLAAQTLGRTGSFAQVAVGYFDAAGGRGTWNTTLVFVNVSAAAASVEVKFRSSAGQALGLPVSGVGVVTERAVTVPGNGSARIEFDAASVPLGVGWVEVTAGAPVRGQGIYQVRAPGRASSEAAVPLAAREPSVCLVPLPNSAEAYPPALLLPYDNTRGYVSSMAFANLSETARTLEVEFLDESGVVAYTLQQPMGPKAHAAFETTNYAAVQGKKGVARVKQNAGEWTGIAFLFSPDGPFATLLPVLR